MVAELSRVRLSDVEADVFGARQDKPLTLIEIRFEMRIRTDVGRGKASQAARSCRAKQHGRFNPAAGNSCLGRDHQDLNVVFSFKRDSNCLWRMPL
jgi:hypothetical protein